MPDIAGCSLKTTTLQTAIASPEIDACY